ncbi:MAG: hypothetical protein WDN00_04535 [Limisphaerales bacterium]
MNSKNTFVWFVLAVVLFASILLFNHYQRAPVAAPGNILPGLQTSTVTAIQVIPAGALEISRRSQGRRLAADQARFLSGAGRRD